MNKLVGAIVGLLVLALIGAAVMWDYTRDKSSESKKALADRQGRENYLDGEQRRLAREIEQFQGRSACQEDGECRVTGLGAKVCDGYANFLFYSMRDANVQALEPVIAQFNRNQSELNDLSLAVPNCGRPSPEVRCINARCAAVAR